MNITPLRNMEKVDRAEFDAYLLSINPMRGAYSNANVYYHNNEMVAMEFVRTGDGHARGDCWIKNWTAGLTQATGVTETNEEETVDAWVAAIQARIDVAVTAEILRRARA